MPSPDPIDLVPRVSWRRRRPSPATLVTGGDVPAAEGDWSVDSVQLVPAADEVPHGPSPRHAMPGSVRMHIVKHFLLRLIDCLNEADFPYWADSGTLLGAIRHGGIIPWDLDCDLGMRRDDLDRLQALVARQPWCFSACEDGVHRIMSSKYDIKICDVFTFTWVPRLGAAFWLAAERRHTLDLTQGFLTHDIAHYRFCLGQRFNLPCSLVYPLTAAPFYDRHIKVPARARQVLLGYYGDRCLTHRGLNDYDSDGHAVGEFRPL